MKRKIINAALILVAITGVYASPKTGRSADNNFSDSLRTGKIKVEAKKSVIKLYPNPSWNGTITVSSNTSEKLHFYIFDLDGTLIHQAVLKEKQKITVNDLKKGVYMYDAFLNDESIEYGKITVK
jgi:Secretion system C-terminal sorting domain